ncbi:MAG TPA: hypothetical protein IAC14_08850 [Candidatus Scybalomonas excrementigallinarum]|nr:hypothetical protein [Candidatus Scybalomonas excrementigallinarum]
MTKEDIKEFINNNFFQLTILAVILAICFISFIVVCKLEAEYESGSNREISRTQD